MELLVAEGAGFLDWHISTELLSRDNDALEFDSANAGSKCNVEVLLDSGEIETFRHDVMVQLCVEVDATTNMA